MGGIIENVFSGFRLFAEFIEISPGHVGQVIIFNSPRNGVDCSELECLFGLILGVAVLTYSDGLGESLESKSLY